MANNKKSNNVKKTASALNSRWLQNTLKSMGVAGTEMIKDLMPATAETVSSATQVASDAINAVKSARTGAESLAKDIKNSSAIKMGQDFFKNALEDIKTGNIYNTEREGSFGGFDDSDMDADTLFGDIDDLMFGDEDGSPDINVVNQEIKNDGGATIKAIDRSTEYQVRSSKAVVDTMVSISSTSIMNTSKIGTEVISQLNNINSNLAAIIEYNNTNMTKFIDASIGYYEQMSAAKSSSTNYGNERITADELYTGSGGLDFSNYKEFVKANIKEYKDSSLVGSALSMIIDNKDLLFGNLVANPLGTILKGSMKALIPQVTKTAMESLDKTMTDFIPVMLERIGSLEDEMEPNTATSFISKVFGVKTKRKKNFDLSKIEKGPVPFNGYANHTIVEIIPKYLRESNAYLREIAAAVTGKNDKELRSSETGFDWETGTFKNLDEMRKNVYDEIQARTTSEFRNSKFGDKMSAQVVHLKSEKDQENYEDALDQLYTMIEQHQGKIDFANKDHMNEIMGGINASDSIKNLIESYIEHLQETADEAIGSAIAAKQKATRERNQAMRDVEESATERGIRQFIDKGSYDAYIKEKYIGTKDASISNEHRGPSKVNASVPSLLQGIQDTLNRGIYVQIKSKLGSSSDSASTESNISRKKVKATPIKKTRSVKNNVQTKDEFKNAFSEDEAEEATISQMIESDNPGFRERFGKESSKQINAFKGVLDGIMAGNSDKAFEEFMNGMRGKFRQAGEFLSEHFFTPIKKHLFGEKDESGYIRGGLFEGVNNRMKESFYSLRRMITGKGYIDAEGNKVEDANEEEMKNTVAGKLKGMLGGLKDGIHEKLFGKKAENEGEEDKEGILPKAKKKISSGVSSLVKGITGWKHALFGESDDEDADPEEEGKKTLEKVKEKAKDVLPSALTGTIVGAAGGTVAGGFLGTMVGGPIGGALLGLAGGIASRSDKFKDWLFGPEDADGKRIGGVISEKVQDYVKENGKYLAGGAALGMARNVITGNAGGFLGTLVGGPLAGAIMGMGTSMLIRSDMFQKFLFGDDVTGQKGLVNTVKGWFGKLGKNKSGDASGGKLAGMIGVGAGVGAITGAMISKVGILGLSLGPMGPIGGALVGLGGAILAQKKNFKEWLFGKVDPETGIKREGIIGKFGNMLSVTVFEPMKNTMIDLGKRFKTFLYYDVLNKFNLIIEPIGNAIFGGLSKITGRAVESLSDLGDVIKEDFLMPALEKARKLLTPVTKAVTTVTKGIYNVGTTIIKAPINLLYGIVSPIGQAVAKTVKGTVGVVTAAINYGVVKPIKTLVVKPLLGAVNLATNIITKPFEIVGKATDFITKKISAFSSRVSIFLHNVGQDFKDWLFKKNPVAKGLRAAGAKVKEFGARVKDTFKILVSPLTEFVKTSLSEVKNHLVNGISRFFSMLNPINWIKGIYGLITGKKRDKKDNDDPTKMGYLRRAWWEAGQIGPRDAGPADDLSYGKRRKNNSYFKKHGREKTYYYAEDGTTYIQSKNGKYYDVIGPDGERSVISAEELPDVSTLTKKVQGVDGDDANDESRELLKKRNENKKKIGKATGWQLKADTAENREIAKAMAAKKGKTISFHDIDTEDSQLRMREARLQEDTLDATESIKDNTYESSGILRNILDTLTFGMTMSPEERQKLREHRQVIKRKAAFLSGYDGAQAREDAEQARKEAEEIAARQAINLESEGYKDAKHKTKKKTNDKYSDIRTRRFEDNYARHGIGGFKAGINDLIGYWKGGINKIWGNEEPKQKDDTNDAEIPKHATGTAYAKRGPAIVGENGPEAIYSKGASVGRIIGMNGPEVINLKGGETIIPNNKINNTTMVEHSNLTDDGIERASDTRKLGIGERILRELFGIKKLTALRSITENPETVQSPDRGSYEEEYDTTNLSKLGNGVRNGMVNLINKIPGTGILMKGVRGVKNTFGAGKTIVGAGHELFKMAKGKTRKTLNRIKSIGQRFGKTKSRTRKGSGFVNQDLIGDDSSDDGDSDSDADDSIQKGKDAQLAVSTLTAENRHAAVLKEEEEKSDNERGDALLQSVNNIEEGQKEYSKLWSSIFGKKGAITGGLLLLAPYLFKFLKSFLTGLDLPIFSSITSILSNLKDTIVDWVDGFRKDLSFGLDNLGDGASVQDKLLDNLKRGTRVYDENGNIDHQTGARKKLRDKLISRKIVSLFGKNEDGVIDNQSVKRGSNNIYTWGKDKLSHFFGSNKEKVGEELAKDNATAAATINPEDVYKSMLYDSAYGTNGFSIPDSFNTHSMTANNIETATNGEKRFKVKPQKVTKDAAEATIDNTFNTENISKMRESVWSDISNNFTPTQMTDDMFGDGFQSVFGTFDDAARTAVKEGAETATEKAAASIGKETTENIVKDVGSKVVREGVEAVTQKAATDESLWAKVTSMLKKAFEGIRDKIIKRSGAKKAAVAAIKSSPDDVMKTIGKSKKSFPKVSGKIASILGITAGLGATVVGLAAKEVTWIAVGALNGLTGAARLFRVDNPDTLMTLISGAIGALSGTTVGSIVDVINELVVSVLGIDILSQFATLIYSGIMRVSGNEEAADALRDAQDEFQQKFEKDKTAEIAKQYKTMQAAGLIGHDVTLDKFIEGANNGEYGVSIKSFADYNDEQHKTIGSQISDSMHDSLSDLKTTFIGSKKNIYTDKKGNVYTQNDDGTYQVKNKSGEDLGYVGEDAIPEDADKTVEKTEGVLVKLGKQIVKTVKPFIKMLIPTIPEITKSIGYIISGHPIELLKSKINIDDKVPMAGIAKALCFIPKITGFVPATMSWLGQKLLKPITSLISGTLDMASDLGTNLSDNINYMTKGDIDGLWSSGVGKESSGIFGMWSKALGYGMKAAVTPITLVSWIGHGLWNGFKGFKEGAVTLFQDNIANFGKIWDYVKGGHPIEMWKDDVNISEDNPLSVLTKIASAAAKTLATPFALISAGFHVLADPVKQLGNTVSIDWDKFNKNSDKVSQMGSDGDISGVWDQSFTCEEGDILAPLFHLFDGVLKVINTVKALIKWLPEKAEDAWEWVNDTGIAKWAKNKFGDSDSTDNSSEAKDPTTTNSDSQSIGGSGDGVIDASITNVSDIKPTDKSTYYSQNDPRWASKKFEKSDGTDDGATIGDTGCGPTAMAMAMSDVTGKTIEPTTMARLAQESGDRDDTGVNWNFVNTAANAYNVNSEQVTSPSASTITSRVSKGEPVVLLGQTTTESDSSPYTRSGHYVVATGLDSRGYVKINDPRGVDHSISVPASSLAPETISMWSFKNNRSQIFPRRQKRSHSRRGGRGNEYLTWLQTDPRWANKKLGKSNDTMASSGCAVTSVAILTVYSNTIVDEDYDPGFLCDYLNENGGLDSSGCLNWNVVPGLSHAGRGDFKNPDKKSVTEKISKLMEDGYFVTLCVQNGGHYVAIIGVDSTNGVLKMKDPAQNEIVNVFDKYSPSSCDSYHYFKGKSSPIEMTSITSSKKKSNAVVSAVKDVVSPIAKVGSYFGKYATALFNAILTGNYDIDWDDIFSDDSSVAETDNTTDAVVNSSVADNEDLSDTNKQYMEAIKKKYGYTPRFDSEKNEYYIYDKNGGKLSGTLEELAADKTSEMDENKARELIKKKYGHSPRYDFDANTYYVYDNNGGKITGSINELAGITRKSSNTIVRNADVEKKWGHNARWDSKTQQYYVYDKTGGKVTASKIEELATTTSPRMYSLKDVEDLIKKRHGNPAKWDSVERKYYVNDKNNGNKIYGTLYELAGIKTTDAVIENEAVKAKTGLSPRFDSKTRKYYIYDNTGGKIYSDTPEGLISDGIDDETKAKNQAMIDYNKDHYYDVNGAAQSYRSTKDLISVAETGDQDAIYELGRRASGLTYDNTLGQYVSYSGYEDDKLAKAWIKEAALYGNITACQAIHRSIELDTSSPFNDPSYLSDEEWDTVEDTLNKYESAVNKDSATRITGMSAGMALMLTGTTPLIEGTAAASGIGTISKYTGKAISGVGTVVAKTPFTGKPGDAVNYALTKAGNFVSENPNANLAMAGAAIAGGSVFRSTKDLDDAAKPIYTGFDMDAWEQQNGGSGNGPAKFGGRGDGVPNVLNKSTYYSQNDPRWSNDKFLRSDGSDDGATIGNTGCGPTAMAMALSDATGKDIKPTETAQLAQITGDRDETGVNWNFIDNAARYYGVDTLQSNNPSSEFIESSLRTGSPVILSGQSDGDVNSPYTPSGHYVVAVGTDSHGNVIINDPRGKEYSKSVNIEHLANLTGSAWLIGSKNKSNKYVAQRTWASKKYSKRGGKGDDYLSWLQSDPRWGSKTLGTSGETMAQSGCAVTTVAKLTVYSQSITGSEYDPGYLCDYLNANGGLDGSGCIYWDVAPGIKHEGRGDFNNPNKSEVMRTISELMNQGYYVALCVKYGGHYVAVLKVTDDGIIMSDPAQNDITNLFDKYPAESCDSYHYFSGSKSPQEINLSFTNSTSDATVVDSAQSDDATSFFSKAGNAIFRAGYTGNWDIDWDEVFSGAIAQSSITGNSTSSTSTGVESNEVIKGKEIKVPKSVQSGVSENYTNYDYWYPKWASSSNQRVIADAWDKKGRKQNKGIAMIDGKYLLAMSPKFGTTGDIVNIKLEDGESFNAILGDSKGADASSEWGHLLGNGKADIIEWEACVGSDSAVGKGFDGISLEGNWKGKYVDSVTNGGSYMDKLQGGGSGTGPKNKRSTKMGSTTTKNNIPRGGSGSGPDGQNKGNGPTVNTNKYSLRPIDAELKDSTTVSTPVHGTPSAAMTDQQRQVAQSVTTTYSDETMEKLMREVINILGVISNNSGNLSLLKDIKSGLSGGNTNNIVSNTNNTTVNANGKSKTKQTSQTSTRMSRNEEAARRIAFGS